MVIPFFTNFYNVLKYDLVSIWKHDKEDNIIYERKGKQYTKLINCVRTFTRLNLRKNILNIEILT